MAEIRDYSTVYFSDTVRLPGGAKQVVANAKPGVIRLYRDMSDPGTLVMSDKNAKCDVEVAWTFVASAKLMQKTTAASVAKAPEVEEPPAGLKAASAPPGPVHGGQASNEGQRQHNQNRGR